MTEKTYIDRAQCEFDRRQARHLHIPNVEFTDRAWDLVLYLFIRQGVEISTGEASRQIDAPRTTLLRHIHALEDAGMVERKSDDCDGRVTLLKLTDRAIEDVTAYLNVDLPTRH